MDAHTKRERATQALLVNRFLYAKCTKTKCISSTHASNNTTIFIIRINRFVCFYPVFNWKAYGIHFASRLKRSRWLRRQTECIAHARGNEWMCARGHMQHIPMRNGILQSAFTETLNNFRSNYGKCSSIYVRPDIDNRSNNSSMISITIRTTSNFTHEDWRAPKNKKRCLVCSTTATIRVVAYGFTEMDLTTSANSRMDFPTNG